MYNMDENQAPIEEQGQDFAETSEVQEGMDAGEVTVSLESLLPTLTNDIQTEGGFSEDSVTALESLGYTRDEIAQYQNTFFPKTESAPQPAVADVVKDFGGDSLVKTALDWASKGMNPIQVESINQRLATNDATSIKSALSEVMQGYYASKADKPSIRSQAPMIITSRKSGRQTGYSGLDGLRSDLGINQEGVASQPDKLGRFYNDPKYQQQVIDKNLAFRERTPKPRLRQNSIFNSRGQ
jgi:hypothetical protein